MKKEQALALYESTVKNYLHYLIFPISPLVYESMDAIRPYMLGRYSNIFSYILSREQSGGFKQDEDYMAFVSNSNLYAEMWEIYSCDSFIITDGWQTVQTIWELFFRLRGGDAKENAKLEIEFDEQFEKIKLSKKRKYKLTEAIEWFLTDANAVKIAKKAGKKILGYSTGFDDIDERTQGLQPWTVTRIIAASNTGKSKLSYAIVNNLLRQDLSVIYFTLEVTSSRLIGNMIANYYMLDYYDVMEMKTEVDYFDFAARKLEVIDDIRTLSQIMRYSEMQKPHVIVIDFAQLVKCGQRSEYENMTTYAQEIQAMAIRSGIAVLDLSQISLQFANNGGEIAGKGSGSLKENGDVCLVMRRNVDDPDKIDIEIWKNKFGKVWEIFSYTPNFSKGTFVRSLDTFPTPTAQRFTTKRK